MKKVLKKHILSFYPLFNLPFSLFGVNVSVATYKQFVKHYFVGFSGAVINYTLFNIFKFAGMDTKIANSITAVVLIITVFILQKFFTYKPDHHSIWQPILFIVNSLVYFFIDTIILVILIDKYSLIAPISKLISMAILSPMSFLFQKFIVFKNKKA